MINNQQTTLSQKTSGKVLMSANLIPSGSVAKYADDSFLDEMAPNAGQFLPRIQLFGANSDLVKRGKIPMAHYGFVAGKDKVEDLGPEIDVVVVSWRPKAMRFQQGQDNDSKGPVSYFNPKSEEFLRIQQDSNEPDAGCMAGPEFLLFVPSQGEFATYFMSSKTARRQAPMLRTFMGRGATLKVQLIQGGKYTWHGPVITQCTTEFNDLPPIEEFERQRDLFNNPKEKEEADTEFDPEKLEAERAR